MIISKSVMMPLSQKKMT